MTNVQTDVLALFNAVVVASHQQIDGRSAELIEQGIVTNFTPNAEQLQVLTEVLKPLDMRTLFTREERETADLSHLLVKQFLHYIEVYGLDTPGLFNLEVNNGQTVSLRYVEGISIQELAFRVEALLYSNAPVKDAAQIQRIVEHYGLVFDINAVVNNELRVSLWHAGLDAFENGDDAVRYLCLKATGSSMLIKSKEVVSKVKAADFPASFFELNMIPLARVFNRHKRIILAAKNKATATAINRIARRSKTAHVPVRESITKTFISKALKNEVGAQVLGVASTRDKFKFLNLLAEKRLQREFGLFKIRNGKIHYTNDRPVYQLDDIERVEMMVLASLAEDLSYLRGRTILLDTAVDYGLPVSRKQTLGRLPFGTTITVKDANEISSGMYWENDWGARDLDLSGVTLDGHRVGWGEYSGYTDRGIIYSGDVTDARNGAMEFLTSRNENYGIVVNIYNGGDGSEMELVVGRNTGQKQWLSETVVREKHALDSKNCLLGFVKGKTFVVYAGRMNNSRVSGVNPTLRAMETSFWTIQQLLLALNINFDVDQQDGMEYDYDLSYEAFSLDKLESLLFRTA